MLMKENSENYLTYSSLSTFLLRFWRGCPAFLFFIFNFCVPVQGHWLPIWGYWLSVFSCFKTAGVTSSFIIRGSSCSCWCCSHFSSHRHGWQRCFLLKFFEEKTSRWNTLVFTVTVIFESEPSKSFRSLKWQRNSLSINCLTKDLQGWWPTVTLINHKVLLLLKSACMSQNNLWQKIPFSFLVTCLGEFAKKCTGQSLHLRLISRGSFIILIYYDFKV